MEDRLGRWDGRSRACVRACVQDPELSHGISCVPPTTTSLDARLISLSLSPSLSRSRLEEREISHHAYPQQKSIISASRLSFLILAQPCGRHRRSSSSSSGSR